MSENHEVMPIVIVGHVDHGKSTLIGRLMADAKALPDGKLEKVKEYCRLNARPFEYAFLLDALKEEQSQGITIDTARCFFKSNKREYLILDAPGHIEFVKNMVTGAAHAQAAILVIDALEGLQENSKRHGFLLSILGIKQIIVVINKMDLVNYQEKIYNSLVTDYTKYLKEINITPTTFLPVSAREGENLLRPSTKLFWHKGPCLLDIMDKLELEKPADQQPFRMPVQDVYKFTLANDHRRIIAGSVESGAISVKQQVIFLPSYKTATIKTIETFNSPKLTSISAGYATGVTIDPQLYITAGEIMCNPKEPLPACTTKLQANIFWLGKKPLIKNKRYKLKIATAQTYASISNILKIIDSSKLKTIVNDKQIKRFQAAECIITLEQTIAFDCASKLPNTSRFVIIDEYDIVGGGTIMQPVTTLQQQDSEEFEPTSIQLPTWNMSTIPSEQRAQLLGTPATLIIIKDAHKKKLLETAQQLEKIMLNQKIPCFYLDRTRVDDEHSTLHRTEDMETEHQDILMFVQTIRILLSAGVSVITTSSKIETIFQYTPTYSLTPSGNDITILSDSIDKNIQQALTTLNT